MARRPPHKKLELKALKLVGLNTNFRVPISKDGDLSLSNYQYYLKASSEYANSKSEGDRPLARV
ncbi:MAG: hypothetical protein V7K64_19145 [Nostoc sp.]|uniref:hypothetical protein n=1 Tax=unclassified Nostoc TaxID=2593658 RepID=UPI001DEC9D29|nr:hypothetical protein [Nostoc sp. JL34]MBN3885729.1 hypothetical protein [Nostoc sp. JL34]